MCKLDGERMQQATAPRDWYAVVDCDGYGDVYRERDEAARDVATFNSSNVPHQPYRLVHLREVTA